MIKKFIKQLDVDAHVIWPLLCDSLNRTSEENCSIQKSLFFQIIFHPYTACRLFLFYLHVRSKHKTLNYASTTASSSSAMLEKHGSTHSSCSTRSSRLARQSRTCRVVSSRAKWNLGLTEPGMG